MLFIYLILLFTCSLFTTIPLIICTFIFTYCLTLISNIIILFHCLSPFLFIYHFTLFCLTLLIPVISICIALLTCSCHYWAVWLHQEPFKDIISKSITPIDNKIIKTILLARKSLLFNKNEVWVKKKHFWFWCNNEYLWWGRGMWVSGTLFPLYFQKGVWWLVCIEMMD